MKKKTLFVAAAHSGGHLIPALVLAQQWRKKNPEGQVVLLTSTEQLDCSITKKYPWVDVHIQLPLERLSLSRSFTCARLIQAFFSCLFYAWRYKPEKLIITGGIVAVPATLSCWAMRSTIDMYELNVVPGKANKVLMPFVTNIFYTFKQTKNYCSFGGKMLTYKSQHVDYPLRYTKERSLAPNKIEQIRAINTLIKTTNQGLEFELGKKTIFILGGSQGSQGLNNCFEKFIKNNAENIKNSLQIIHQSHQSTIDDLKRTYQALNISAYVFSFSDTIESFYQIADLVICRAGAGTLFELEYFQTPALIVPLVTRNTCHQRANAYAMANNKPKQFVVLEQKAIEKEPTILSKAIRKAIIEQACRIATPEQAQRFPLLA